MTVPDQIFMGDGYAYDDTESVVVHGIPIDIPRDAEARVGDLARFDVMDFEEWLDDADILGALGLLVDFRYDVTRKQYRGTAFGMEFRTSRPEYDGANRDPRLVGIVDESAFARFLERKGLLEEFASQWR